MLKLRPAIKYSIDGAVILVVAVATMFFLLKPDAFNALLAWAFQAHH
jgi:hypothetical protein